MTKKDEAPLRPAFPAGIVEGFYGPPWRHEERLLTIRFLGRVGMNLYIYAPKEDPFHRERWRVPYPAGKAARFRELAAACRKEKVVFNFALSPGLSIAYASKRDRAALQDKYLAAADWGADAFSLLLDDIPPSLGKGKDRNAFGDLSRAHADLANDLRRRLDERCGREAPLLFCPTEYAGLPRTSYLETLGRELDPRIAVFWTGPRVVSAAIGPADARAFGERIGRKPFLWDNYPVNDFAPDRLFLGPFRGREPGLEEELEGYAANPMNQARASQAALRTLAARLAAPGIYDPESAWEEAIRSQWRDALEEAGAGAAAGGPGDRGGAGDPEGGKGVPGPWGNGETTHPAGGPGRGGEIRTGELAAAFRTVAAFFKPSPLEEEHDTPLSREARRGELFRAGKTGKIGEIESAAEDLLRAAGGIPLLVETAGWIRDVLLRCRTLRAAAEAKALLEAGERGAARRIALAAWPERELVGRRHTLSSGEEMRLADEILLPQAREEGRLLFSPAPPRGEEGKEPGKEDVLLDLDRAMEGGPAEPPRARAVLDAGPGPAGREGGILRAERALLLSGKPWMKDPPGEPPALRISKDGKVFTPLPLAGRGGVAVSDLKGRPFRFLEVEGVAEAPVYLLLEGVRTIQPRGGDGLP